MNLLSLSFISKARERLLVDGHRIEKMISGPESHLMSLASIGPDKTVAEADALLYERQFMFVNELLSQAKGSWLHLFFVSDARFAAMKKISSGDPLSETYRAADSSFAASAIATLGAAAKTSSGSAEHDMQISMYRKSPHFLYGLYSYKRAIVDASCDDQVFRSILAKEIDAVNIKLLLGSLLSGSKMPDPVLGGTFPPEFFRTLSTRPVTDSFLKLSHAGWGSIFHGQSVDQDWAAVEKRIDEVLYEYSRRSLYVLLGPAPVYNYVLAKRMETRNFRIILAVKKLRLPESSVVPYLYNFLKN